MRIFAILHQCSCISRTKPLISATEPIQKIGFKRRWFSKYSNEDPELKEFLNYLDNLKNYEKSGVPKDAGTDSDDGFDMGRMNRLMQRLGNPHSQFKVVHIAGTKGKGSTAAFLSNILREEGYSVGSYTSPHLWSIRERISLGRKGDLVSSKALSSLFHRVKDILNHSIELENGSISHFEVFTAVAFTLFAQEKVDIAVVEAGLGGARDATNVFCSSMLAASVITTIGEEHLAALGGSLESIAMAKSGIIKHSRPVVLGGPFKPHIEHILRGRASSMSSPVVSASDPGNRSIIKSFKVHSGKSWQSCDIILQIEKDLPLFIELNDVKLHMLGSHQLHNAVIATCVSLCLRDQGWKLSDESIRAGLENTRLLGRSQFLTSEESEAVGLAGVHILVDGAHTKESAKSLIDMIQLTRPSSSLALVIAMANDKDHLAFARQILSGSQPDVVILTEVSIAGGRSRMTPASLLKEVWTKAADELGIGLLDIGMGGDAEKSGPFPGEGEGEGSMVLGIGGSSVEESMKIADKILKSRKVGYSPLIVVTGSLHIVSLVLACSRVNLMFGS